MLTMTMSGLSVCLYMTIFVCLRFDVRGELTVDVAYSLLSSRLETLELETFSIKSSMTSIDNRIDQIEMLIKSQLPTNTHVIEVSEGRNEKVEMKQMNQANEKILNAFASEKLFIRNTLSEYEEQFTELRKTVNDQMILMNKSMEVSNENFERKIEETEANMNHSLNQFKTNSDIELQGVIIEFETAMNNTATEHETTVSNVKDVRNTVQNIENDLSSQSSRISAVDNRLSSLYNSQDRNIRSLESKHSGKISSLESRVSTLHSSQASDISSVRSRVSSLEDKKVGFTARLTKHLNKYAKNKIIVFDGIKSNYGGGYSSSTGKFTAPKTGLYLFQFNVEAYRSQEVHAVFLVNGYNKAEANVNNGPNFTGSNAAVVYMYAGQKAYIRTANLKDPSYGIAGYRTSFSGVLIN